MTSRYSIKEIEAALAWFSKKGQASTVKIEIDDRARLVLSTVNGVTGDSTKIIIYRVDDGGSNSMLMPEIVRTERFSSSGNNP